MLYMCSQRRGWGFQVSPEHWNVAQPRTPHGEYDESARCSRCEFAAAIHPHRCDGEGHAIDQRLQEVCRTSRQEALARAEKCFSTTPRAGGRLLNGPKTVFSPSPGRARIFRPRVGIWEEDFASMPRSFRSLRIRPTIKVESGRFLRRRSTNSLSFPQLGYSRAARGQLRSGRSPGRLATPMRMVRAIFQTREIVRIIAVPTSDRTSDRWAQSGGR